MANEDRVLELYQGKIDSQRSQTLCRERVHWLCTHAGGPRVLDIGCSQGICAVILAREGRTVLGIDIEEGGIRAAREFLAGEPPHVQAHVRFEVADAFRVELAPASFDSIILGEVIEHLASPEVLLDRVAEWLTPGGRVVVSTPLGYMPHHDHKHTFYLAGLLQLLGRRFTTVEVDVIEHRYLCAVAVKPCAEAPAAPAPELLQRWQRLVENAQEQAERDMHTRWREDHATVVELRAALSALRLELKRVSRQAQQQAAFAQQLAEAQAKLQDLDNALAASRAEQARWETAASEAARALQPVRDELARVRAELRRKDAELTSASQKLRADRRGRERDRAARGRAEARIRRLVEHIRYYEAELERRRGEVRYRLGDALVQAARPSKATLLLPFRLLELFRDGLRRQRERARQPVLPRPAPTEALSDASSAPAAEPPEPRPTDGAEGASAQSPVRQATKPVEPVAPPRASTPAQPAASLTFPPFQPRAVPRGPTPRVASILDNFSHACFAYELDLLPVTKAGWQAELEAGRPAFFFAESAWHGNNDEWFGLFRKYARIPDNPLRALLHWCRAQGLPTVLWNKEDPPNYSVFLDVARDFDHVFTTDADCIPRYHRDLGHERVYALPFAAQPVIHNPVGAHELRRHDICFAGSWHDNKHPERQGDMRTVLEPALRLNLHIFDRCANFADNTHRRFPEIYQPAIRGSLEYDRMLSAYRAYRVFLNVNSVSTSPTMFSRRVFELLACQTAVISSESAGIRQMLGDLVPIATLPDETLFHIHQLLGDAEWRQRFTHLGYRRVMTQHTYRHRLATIVRALGLDVGLGTDPCVSVVTILRARADLDAAIRNYQAQVYAPREWVLVLQGDELRAADVERGVAELPDVRIWTRPAQESPGACLNFAVEQCRGRYVAVFDPAHHYGAHYLVDMLLPFRFAGAGVVGKACVYSHRADRNATVLHGRGREQVDVECIHPGTVMADADVVRKIRFETGPEEPCVRFVAACRRQGVGIYAADRYNFVAGGRDPRAAQAADELGAPEEVGSGLRLDLAMLADDSGAPCVERVPTLAEPVPEAVTALQPLPARPPPRRRRPARERGGGGRPSSGFLFYCVNGAGLGHVTRALAIARRVRRLDPDTPLYFLSSSQALGLISREGFVPYHIPPRNVYGANYEASLWNNLLLQQFRLLVDLHRPATLVYDGVTPYAGLTRALAELPFAHTAMILRLRHKHNRLGQWLDQLALFNELIFPGEAGVEVPAEFAPLPHHVVDPIIYLDPDELLPRDEARRNLNIAPDKKAVYIQLGAGNINNTVPWVEHALTLLHARPDVEVVLAESPIAEHADGARPGLHLLRQYPNSLFFNAFDLAITAAGYNTYHELMHFGVPSVLIPNQETVTDDQVARAQTAAAAGAARVVLSMDELEPALHAALDEDAARAMRASALALVPRNGALDVARDLLEVAGLAAREEAMAAATPAEAGGGP